MRDPVRLSDVTFTAAPPNLRSTGLLGWIRLVYGELQVNGIQLRRRLDGTHRIKFPNHRDRRGVGHTFVAPVDEDARNRIEAALLAQLRRGQ